MIQRSSLPLKLPAVVVYQAALSAIKDAFPRPFDMTDDIRSRSAKLLETSIAASLSSGSSDVSQLASSLEEAIFQASGSSTGNEYRDAVRQRSLVLKKDNPELATSLVEGTISVEEVARATSQVSIAGSSVPLTFQDSLRGISSSFPSSSNYNPLSNLSLTLSYSKKTSSNPWASLPTLTTPSYRESRQSQRSRRAMTRRNWEWQRRCSEGRESLLAGNSQRWARRWKE